MNITKFVENFLFGSVMFLLGLAFAYYQIPSTISKYPSSTRVYMDDVVDIGYVAKFDPKTEMLVWTYNEKNQKYLRIVDKVDVYQYD